MNDTDLVQAIMLAPKAKQYNLSDVTRAVALASLRGYLSDKTAPGDPHSAYSEWLRGRFTKSVRVAKSWTDYEEALRTSAALAVSNEVTALAFTPQRYVAMPKFLRRARVSGLQCVDDLPDQPDLNVDWNLAVVAEMSSGKTAAQIAHAVMKAALVMSEMPTFHVYRSDRVPEDFTFDITDAGLTEFDRPTRTIVALNRYQVRDFSRPLS